MSGYAQLTQGQRNIYCFHLRDLKPVPIELCDELSTLAEMTRNLSWKITLQNMAHVISE